MASGFADLGFQLSWIFGHEQEKNRATVFFVWSMKLRQLTCLGFILGSANLVSGSFYSLLLKSHNE